MFGWAKNFFAKYFLKGSSIDFHGIGEKVVKIL